jgi:hypothetical protein
MNDFSVTVQMIVFASSGNVKEMSACLEQGANIDARDAVRALFLFERQLDITCCAFILILNRHLNLSCIFVIFRMLTHVEIPGRRRHSADLGMQQGSRRMR